MPLLNAIVSICIVLSCCTLYAEELYGRCVNVSSGDTFSLMQPRQKTLTVHLKGVVAPKEGEPFFGESRKKLTALLLDKPVVVIVKTIEASGCSEGKVQVGDVDVNVEMIECGLCRWDRNADLPDEKHCVAEETARLKKVGLWNASATLSDITPSFANTTPDRIKRASQNGELWITEDSSVHNSCCRKYGKSKGIFTYTPTKGHNCVLCGGKLEDVRDYSTVKKAHVTRVVDGDTLTITTPDGSMRSVSLYGCDAPEKGQKHGESARAELEKLIKDKDVFIVLGDKDLRKRKTTKLYVDGIYVNRRMLEKGYGVVPPDCKDKKFHSYQSQAEKVKVGMWVAGIGAAAIVAPWTYRFQQEARQAQIAAESAEVERRYLERQARREKHKTHESTAVQIVPPRYTPKSSSTGGDVYVHGYYRKDGTYVRPHTRRR